MRGLLNNCKANWRTAKKKKRKEKEDVRWEMEGRMKGYLEMPAATWGPSSLSNIEQLCLLTVGWTGGKKNQCGKTPSLDCRVTSPWSEVTYICTTTGGACEEIMKKGTMGFRRHCATALCSSAEFPRRNQQWIINKTHHKRNDLSGFALRTEESRKSPTRISNQACSHFHD